MSRVWSLLVLLLCLSALPAARAKKRQSSPTDGKSPQTPTPPAPAAQAATKRPRNKSSVPGSGELSTKDGHRCTWETTAAGEDVVSLLVRCHQDGGGGEEKEEQEGEEEGSYWCRYVGRPDLCGAYAAKSSQYWKQLLGKLKKRRRACDGEKVLKTRTCKKAPADAHMKLAQRSGEEEGKKKKEENGEKKKGGGGGGKKKSPGTQQAPEATTERKRGEKKGEKKEEKKGEKEEEKKGEKEEEKKEEKEEEKKEEKKEEMEVAEFAGGRDEGEVNDMEPVESYCAEGWHSVCSFFVKFFEG